MTTDRLLLGPGPSNPYPEAMAALARPVLGHMDPEFLVVLDETMERLRDGVPHRERAHAADQRHRLGGHGGVLRQPARAGRHRDRRRQRRVRRPHVRGRAPLRRRGRARRGGVGPRARPAAPARRAARAPATRASSPSCTRRRRTGVENDIAPLAALQDTDTLLRRRHRHVARRHPGRDRRLGRRRRYSGTQKCLGVPPGLVAGDVLAARGRARRSTRRTPPQSWYLDLGLHRELRRRRRRACTTTPRRSR